MTSARGTARLFTFAAGCAAIYLAVQTLQLVLRSTGAETLRATTVLLSFFGLPPIYAAVALRRFHRAPASCVCGVAFGLLFVAFELAYRSLELFMVARPALWEQAVEAWYFPLLAVHMASSTAFTVACWPRAGDDRWDVLAAASFGLNALRLLGRLLGGYAGVAPLAALSGPLYFPAVATVNVLLVAWLARQAALTRRAPA